MDTHSRDSDIRMRVLADQLLRINGTSYAEGHFEVAYHVLSAALHCAEDLVDPEMAASVQQRAEQQQAKLDQTEPPHPLSTAGASRRGTHPLFTSLGRTAHAARVRIKAQLAQAHAQSVRRGHLPSGDFP
ncbi:MAG TPA: hypothetical protein VFT28_10585 [Gemmatimonadales bacterium]|nr:hypothetical protein [Gemmatimonadales bacterium]